MESKDAKTASLTFTLAKFIVSKNLKVTIKEKAKSNNYRSPRFALAEWTRKRQTLVSTANRVLSKIKNKLRANSTVPV